MKTYAETLREQRDALTADIEGGLAAIEYRVASDPAADMSPEESADFERLCAEARGLDAKLAGIDAAEARRQVAAAAAAGTVRVNAEPRVYERGNDRSYLKDLAFAHHPGGHPRQAEALTRLQRHAVEVEVDMADRERRRADKAETELRSTFGESSAFEKRTNPNRTDGQGGYFVPPLWMVDQFIPGLRAGRPVVNRLRQMDLPAGTDSINIPKLSTLTTTAVQTADAGSVSSTDFTDTSVSAGVKTIAGQEDVSLQLLEQSPGQIIDQVVLADLTADYNRNCDRQSLNGTGINGQVLGLDQLSSPNAITYTDSDPTGAEFYAPLAQSLSKIATARYDLSNVFFAMHPRRWFWLAATVDSTGRPLVVPSNMSPMNPLAESSLAAEGFVGNTTLGPPVIIDANVTTTDSSTRDKAYAIKADDTFWFEGSLRTRVLFEILSGTLQVRFQVYNYVAQLTRYDESVSIISGSGMAAPSGY